ncbi:MAG: NYN domain-containing protein [candidate division KSB1 bacterium]|nr:NYN domain-containing protein [candidate division KSB1 bacterium]MDZ7333619.1 NYN domain-containing protein [candidate division KSB1 bacterium]MDZ7357805.1 NYN domain-containing protein [candidate division KSB1 bacterium]MDZ7398733.1 NYN domain-containing protein [candidate division KSB1 bacterium]
MYPHYLIDGYNLIHVVSELSRFLDSGLEQARNRLIHLLQSYAVTHRVAITVVFDGNEVGHIEPPVPANPRLQIRYSHPPEKADPVIKRIIDKAKNRRSIILISADNELTRYGRASGTQVLSPQGFFDRICQPANQKQMEQKFNSELSEAELADWLKIFRAQDK